MLVLNLISSLDILVTDEASPYRRQNIEWLQYGSFPPSESGAMRDFLGW